MAKYIETLRFSLKSLADPVEKERMTKYMKNNFEFYGVRMPKVKETLNNHIKSEGLPSSFAELDQIIRIAWTFPEREMQYSGMYLMDKSRTIWNNDFVVLEELFAFMISNKSWWDTVDFISSSLVFHWWKLAPDLIDQNVAPKWNLSDNFWLNRTSIIYQLRKKTDTNTQILSDHILRHCHSKEFFVQKAIGWSLREYAKINTNWVLDFVKQNELKPLSKREALKQIKAGRIRKPW